MRAGSIGYGSMGKRLLTKFSESGIGKEDLSVSNRTQEKLLEAKDIAVITDNRGVARRADIVFVCVRPSDLKSVLEEIRDAIDPDLELGIGDIPSMSDKVFSSCVSIRDLTRDTGFVPEVSFEDGISRTIEYYDRLSKDKQQ